MKQLFIIIPIIFCFHASAQNVGVGETAPNMKLEVKAPDSAVLLLHNSTAAAANVKTGLFWKTGAYYSGSIANICTSPGFFRLGMFTFGSSDPADLQERMTILDGGNVGIGTINPTTKLEVNGQVKITDGSQGPGKLLQSDGTGIASWVDKSASLLPAGVTGNTLRNASGSWITSNLIYNNGTNIGVGATDPSFLLDINGRARLRYNGSTPGIWYNKADNTAGAFIGMYDDTTYGFYGSSGGWWTSMDLKNGRLGIGTMDPTVPLSFTTAFGKKISMYHGSSGDVGFGVYGNELRMHSDYSGADITFGYDDYTAGFTEKMRLKGNGNLYVGTSLASPTSKLSVFETTNTNSRAAYIGINNGISGNEGLRVESLSGSNGTAILAYRNSTTGNAIAATSNGGVAVDVFSGSSAADVGLRANAGVGVRGTTSASTGGIGVYGSSGSNASNIAIYSAGQAYIQGNMDVAGTLSKSAGSFKIDHPLDPANKFLYHSFVESPDMMNVYNGTIVTDADGFAKVSLPGYFDALNIDFKYQLTIVGKEFAQALVYEEIKDNQFIIRTDKPNIKVSWQVTGIRNDAYAKKHPIVPEVQKTGDQKGKYLWPELFNQPEDKKINKRD